MTKEEIRQIKCEHLQGAPIEQLSWMYHCHPAIILEIVSGRYERREDNNGKVFTINDKEPRCTAT